MFKHYGRQFEMFYSHISGFSFPYLKEHINETEEYNTDTELTALDE